MPVGTLAAPWAQVSGKFFGSPDLSPSEGAIVAMPQPNGQTNIRKQFLPNQPNSPMQQLMKGLQTSVSEAYQSLSIQDVQTWRDLASQLTASNRFGANYTPSWNHVFSQVNNYRLQAGLSIVTTAPTWDPGPVILFDPAEMPNPVYSEEDAPDWNLSVRLAWVVPEDAVDTLPIRCRFSRQTDSPVLQIPDNELRMVNSQLANNWSLSVDTGTFIYSVVANNLNVEPGQHIAVELLVLTPGYIPSQKLVLRNTIVQEV